MEGKRQREHLTLSWCWCHPWKAFIKESYTQHFLNQKIFAFSSLTPDSHLLFLLLSSYPSFWGNCIEIGFGLKNIFMGNKIYLIYSLYEYLKICLLILQLTVQGWWSIFWGWMDLSTYHHGGATTMESADFKGVQKLMWQGLSYNSCELVCGMWAMNRNLVLRWAELLRGWG